MLVKRLVTLATVVATSGLLLGAAFVGTAGAASASAGTSKPIPGGPIIRAPGGAGSAAGTGLPTISLNWSGYAATSAKKFNYVHTQFVQPEISCTGARNRWTSNWTGLDGFTTGTVEQTGTFGLCGGPAHKTPVYEAWYEMYPAGSVNVFKVAPGDVINATVKYTAGKFVITIADVTSGKSATVSAACSSCQRASAEWIIERPALCNTALTNCFLTALANFGTTTMGQAKARVAGGSIRPIGTFSNVPIFMVDPLKSGGFISLDTVGALNGPSFSVVWNRSGTITPITL